MKSEKEELTPWLESCLSTGEEWARDALLRLFLDKTQVETVIAWMKKDGSLIRYSRSVGLLGEEEVKNLLEAMA